MWIWLANIMGRSLQGIPEKLRHAGAKPAFIIWLRELPVSKNAKRPLIYAWRDHTGSKFTHTDYLDMGFF